MYLWECPTAHVTSSPTGKAAMMRFPSHVSHLHPFRYSHYFPYRPCIQTKTTSPDWILRPTCRLGPGLWKPHRACQLLTDLRRALSAEAQAGSQPSPGPQAPDTLPNSPAPHCLPAVGHASVLTPTPHTVRTQEERLFAQVGGTQRNTAPARKQKQTSSGTAPLLLRDRQ